MVIAKRLLYSYNRDDNYRLGLFFYKEDVCIMLKILNRLLKKKQETAKEFKEYNALNLNILCRPAVPIQYLENCRDNLYISDILRKYLNQYYLLIYQILK